MKLKQIAVLIAAAICSGQPLLAHAEGSAASLPFAAADKGKTEAVTLAAFATLMSSSDEMVLVQRLEEDIAREGVRGANAMFEPTLALSIDHDSSYVLNSSNEVLQRAGQATYKSDTDNYKAALGAKLSSGADVELSYNVSSNENSLQTTTGSVRPEWRAYLGLKLTQPLLRGAGKEMTTSPIKIAEFDQSVARETVRQVLTQRLMDGSVAYFNLQRAQERVRLRTQALDIAERLVKEIHSQVQHGLKSASEALDADSSLALRRSQLMQAQQDLSEQMNAFQSLLAARRREQGGMLTSHLYTAADPIKLLAGENEVAEVLRDINTPTADANSMPNFLATSLDQRPENRVNRLRIDREDVRLRYAEDQARPELNLVARYGIEDLNTKPEYRTPDAYLGGESIPYNSWMIGVQYKIGLFGDDKKKAEVAAARLRRQQALLAQNAVQQRIANELVTSLAVLDKTIQQVKRQRDIVATQKGLLDIENDQFREGRKSSVDVMKRELDHLVAEENLAETIVLANRASFIVAQARGQVLHRLGLE